MKKVLTNRVISNYLDGHSVSIRLKKINSYFTSKIKRRLFLALLFTVPLLTAIVLGLPEKNWAPDYSATGGQEHLIVLKEDGFDPDHLTIKAGDVVKFTTSRSKHFWPASNLHPTHEIYSDFDPGKPIPLGESWNFRFDKEGEWKYHDHLSPYYTGIIKVSGKSQSFVLSSCQENLSQQECWADAVEKTILNQGIDAAFDLIATIFNEEAEGPASCHNLVHKAGDAAFKLFSTNREFKITPKASFCNYGFYHGFMEKIILSGEDLKKASQFCDYIDNQLKITAPNSGKQCYHGIGHGTVSSHDPRLWGNEQAMIDPAIKLCQDISTNEDHLYRCVSGVYNGIGNFYVDSEFRLQVNKDDPFWVCRLQKNELYADACYGNLHPTIAWLSENNFTRAIKYVESISEDNFAVKTIRYVAGDFARLALNKENFEEEIEICRRSQERLRQSCILGLSTGLMDSGKPNEEYVTAFNFCRSNAFGIPEKNNCFQFTLSYLSTMYSTDKFRDVCSKVEAEYLKYCDA